MTHQSQFNEVTRSWNTRRRAFWWVKFAGAVACAIVSLAAAARLLGLNIDIQSKTAARAENAELRKEVKDDQERALDRIDTKIDTLSGRFDSLLEALAVRGNNQPKRKGSE